MAAHLYWHLTITDIASSTHVVINELEMRSIIDGPSVVC
jgi:hypothetical protein